MRPLPTRPRARCRRRRERASSGPPRLHRLRRTLSRNPSLSSPFPPRSLLPRPCPRPPAWPPPPRRLRPRRARSSRKASRPRGRGTHGLPASGSFSRLLRRPRPAGRENLQPRVAYTRLTDDRPADHLGLRRAGRGPDPGGVPGQLAGPGETSTHTARAASSTFSSSRSWAPSAPSARRPSPSITVVGRARPRRRRHARRVHVRRARDADGLRRGLADDPAGGPGHHERSRSWASLPVRAFRRPQSGRGERVVGRSPPRRS